MLLGLNPAEVQAGGKGDGAFYQIWTPPPTAKQWDPDRSADTRYQERELSPLLGRGALTLLLTLSQITWRVRRGGGEVKGRLLTLVSHSSVQFEAPNTTCVWLNPGSAILRMCVCERERARGKTEQNKTEKKPYNTQQLKKGSRKSDTIEGDL